MNNFRYNEEKCINKAIQMTEYWDKVNKLSRVCRYMKNEEF